MFKVTANEQTGKLEVKIGDTVHQFDDANAAAEFVGNQDNIAAAQVWHRAAEGGTKYRAERLGLLILRQVFEAEAKAAKAKAKDLTASQIFDMVNRITDEDIDDAVQTAKQLRAAFATLNGKYQATMKGAVTPRKVAESAAVLVKPETGAAQQETARSLIASSY